MRQIMNLVPSVAESNEQETPLYYHSLNENTIQICQLDLTSKNPNPLFVLVDTIMGVNVDTDVELF